MWKKRILKPDEDVHNMRSIQLNQYALRIAKMFVREGFFKLERCRVTKDFEKLREFYTPEFINIIEKQSYNEALKRNVVITNILLKSENVVDEIRVVDAEVTYRFEVEESNEVKVKLQQDIFVIMQKHKIYKGYICINCGNEVETTGECKSCGTNNFNKRYFGWFIKEIKRGKEISF